MAPSSGGGMKQKSMAIMHDCGSNLAWEDLEKKLIYQDSGTSHHHHHHNDNHDDPSMYPIIRGVMTELCDDGFTAIRRPNGQEYDEPIILERPAPRKFDSPIMSKTKPGKKDIDSYTIKGTSKIVKVDDCVLMRASDVDKPPYVARIEKIESDGKNNVKVKVRWYYRPEESIGGRRQFHGAKELFLSDHFDWQSANTIEGICIVHSFKNYTKLENVGQEDFFCRFEYKAATGAFTPDRVAVYCKCEMPYNPDDLMVQCDACKDWFHPSCMEMSIEDAKKLDHFLCSDCQPENEPKRTPNGFSSSPNSEPKVESKRRKRQGRG